MHIDKPVVVNSIVAFAFAFEIRTVRRNIHLRYIIELMWTNFIMLIVHVHSISMNGAWFAWLLSKRLSTWLNYHIVPLPLTINIEVLIIIIFDCTNPWYNAIQRTKLFTGNRRSRLTHTDPCWSNVQYYSSINIQSSLLKQRAAIDQEINPSFVEGVNGNSVGTIIQSVIWPELDSHYHQTRRKYGRETRECDVRGW